MNKYMFTDGKKSIDLPQYPNEAWQFYGEADDNDSKIDLYASVAAVFRALNLTANATAGIPFALVNGKTDYDVSDDWQNKVGFMPKPKELIRLWRLSLSATNSAYGFMENTKLIGKNLRYIVPSTITPNVDKDKGLLGFKRTIGSGSKDYALGKNNPIFWMWRMDHTTELLPAKATEFQAMCAAAGILYYADNHIQAFFKRGGIKPTMLVLKGMTNKENIDKIENTWTKIISGGYKWLGKVFQGVDASGGLEATPIGEGVDSLKDENINRTKIEAVAMALGIPLSLLLSNSNNYATAQVEYKSWYDNSLSPWCEFIADEMTDKLFKPLGLKFVFRPEMSDVGQEEEVTRASAYSTYVSSKMKPSVAAQIVGIELPEGMEYDELDAMAEEADQKAADAQSKLQQDKLQLIEKQGSSDTTTEKKPAKGWVTINGAHVLIGEEGDKLKDTFNHDSTSERIEGRVAFGFTPNNEIAYSIYDEESDSQAAHGTLARSNGLNDEGDFKARGYLTHFKGDDGEYYPVAIVYGHSNWGKDAEQRVNYFNRHLDELLKETGFEKPVKIYVSFNGGYTGIDQNKWNPDDLNTYLVKHIAKFIPNIDQLKEMELWRKFAFRHFKKAEPLTFAFEVKTLPDEIAESIRLGLEVADSEDAIKEAFQIDEVKPVEINGNKSDLAILELADAINKACENATIPD